MVQATQRLLAHCAAGRSMRTALLDEGLLMGLGNVYYVNGITWSNGFGAGSDSNDGLSPDSPLMTITAALAKCTDEADDFIVVLDYWQGTGESWPIVVDKGLVHITGLPGYGGMHLAPKWAMIYPVGDYAAFSIQANNVYLSNFHLYGGATKGAIEISGTRSAFVVHHCGLGEVTTGQDGIRLLSAAELSFALIASCHFGKSLTRDGIRCPADATITFSIVRDNLFMSVPGVGINNLQAAGAARMGAILDNRFGLISDTKGKAITLAGGANCFVDGNRANVGVTDMSANPYLDEGSNDWGLNYKGITALLPATS